jgi:hypothetical protein
MSKKHKHDKKHKKDKKKYRDVEITGLQFVSDEFTKSVTEIVDAIRAMSNPKKIYGEVSFKKETIPGTKVDGAELPTMNLREYSVIPEDSDIADETITLVYSAGFPPEWYEVTGGHMRKLTPEEVQKLHRSEEEEEFENETG